MKKYFRLVVKILFTPGFVAFTLSTLFFGYFMSGWLWLFDKDSDLAFNQLLLKDLQQDIKKWFTTI